MSSCGRLVPFAFLLVCSCRYTDVDYDALRAGGLSETPWALLDLEIHASSFSGDEGEIVLALSSHLTQHSQVAGVDLQFLANGEALEFTAPDTNNSATLADDGILIDMIKLNLIDSQGKPVCPNPAKPIVTNELTHDAEEGVIFSATDLACADNLRVKVSAIAQSIANLSKDNQHSWPDEQEYREVLGKAEEFYQEEMAKGENGVLHKTNDEKINSYIDDFLIRLKMLKGYDAMYGGLKKNKDLATMKAQTMDADHADRDKHVVIPAVLGVFLDPSVNNRVTPEESTGEAGIDLLLLKEAMGNAAVKFLQYQHTFASDGHFASNDMQTRYSNLVSELPSEVQDHIREITDRFNDAKNALAEQDVPINVYHRISTVHGPLSAHLTCMNTFLSKRKAEGFACEDSLSEFYRRLTTSCGEGDEEGADLLGGAADLFKDADIFVLLTTRKIMEETGLHKVCPGYAIKLDKFNENYIKLIPAGVKDLKESVIKGMEDIQKNYRADNFRAELLRNYFYTAAPIVTEHPDKADELAAALVTAHDDVFDRKKADAFWQGALSILVGASGALGVAAAVLWLFPPAGAATSVLASALMLASLAIGAFSAIGYVSDYLHEKSDYAMLEKSIYSGGREAVGELANTMQEWKDAKRSAIWEGIFATVGVGPARSIITSPRVARSAYTASNIKASLKNSAEKARIWQAARKQNMGAWRERMTKIKDIRAQRKEKWKEAIKGGNEKEMAATRAKLDNTDRLYNAIRRKKPGIVAKAREVIARGWKEASGRAKGLRNVQAGQLTGKLSGIEESFRKNIDGLKDSVKRVKIKNIEAWKHSELLDTAAGYSKNFKQKGMKFNYKLRKDGQVAAKLDDGAIKFMDAGIVPAENIKLGADGLWFMVLSAGQLDKLFGGGGQRAIEESLP